MTMRLAKILAASIAGLILLSGCAYYRPAKEVGTSQEIEGKSGPGLFTGKSGEWVVYSR